MAREAVSKPPKRIQVGPYGIDVFVSDKKVAEHALSRGDRPDTLAGGCDVSGGRIVLAQKPTHDYRAETLLHEVLHACFVVMATPLEHDVEEETIGALSPVLLDTLRRNPALTAYLLDDGS